MSTTELTAAASGPPVEPERLDRALVMVAIVVLLGTAMAILDTTVVNVAVDTIARRFHSPLSTVQWIVTGYALALAIVIPLTGWVADRFGTKRLYMGAISVFLFGSALAGASWNDGSLITARIVQGFGGGMLGPAGMTILTHAAGPKRLGRIMAFIGVPMLIAPILGPVLGGWLVDSFSWRWIFFINLPMGAVALVLCQRAMDPDPGKNEYKLDWRGLLLLIPGLSAFIFGVASINTAGGFFHVGVLVPVVAGVALLTQFVRHSLHIPYGLIDPRLFLNRTFSAASATFFLGLVAAFGSFLLFPLYLQAVRGESAVNTGLLMIPLGVGAAVAMPVVGLLADRIAFGLIAPVGMLAIGGAFVGFTQLTANTSYTYIGICFAVLGAGIAATMVPMFSGIMQTLREEEVARASTAINIMQQAGAAIGTAILSVVLSHEFTIRHLGKGGIGSTALRFAAGPRAVAAAHAFAATFVYTLPLLGVAFLVALIYLPKKRVAEPAA